MENTGLVVPGFAVAQALASGRERDGTDFSELSQVLHFSSQHLEKIDSLMRRLGVSRRTIINMAIKYAVEVAHEVNPDALLAVKGFPRQVGNNAIRHEITADVRSLIEMHDIGKYCNQFAIFGLNKLHAKLARKPALRRNPIKASLTR